MKKHKPYKLEDLKPCPFCGGDAYYLDDYSKPYFFHKVCMGHKKLWWYIEQNDYNLYYAENEVSGRYRDFEQEVDT